MMRKIIVLLFVILLVTAGLVVIGRATRGLTGPSPDQRRLREKLEQSGSIVVLQKASQAVIGGAKPSEEEWQHLQRGGALYWSRVETESGEYMAAFYYGGGLLHFGLLVGKPEAPPRVKGWYLFEWEHDIWFYSDEEVRDTR